MKYFTLIILLVFTSLVGCSNEGESELTEEKVDAVLSKCLEEENTWELISVDPIFIENNTAIVTYSVKNKNHGYSDGGQSRFRKDSVGKWYLTAVQVGSYRRCKGILPLLVE